MTVGNNEIVAVIATSKGDVAIKLFHEQAPLTVANFVGLAEGKIKNDHKPEGTPYYDGLNFHRVISRANGDSMDFMVQGGCPLGTGTGNPGYSFKDEFQPELRHDKPGILSMANAGPRTNGSQFFITIIPTPHLDGAHTVFGEVIDGLEVVTDNIVGGDAINKVSIHYGSDLAGKYDAAAIFSELR